MWSFKAGGENTPITTGPFKPKVWVEVVMFLLPLGIKIVTPGWMLKRLCEEMVKDYDSGLGITLSSTTIM